MNDLIIYQKFQDVNNFLILYKKYTQGIFIIHYRSKLLSKFIKMNKEGLLENSCCTY